VELPFHYFLVRLKLAELLVDRGISIGDRFPELIAEFGDGFDYIDFEGAVVLDRTINFVIESINSVKNTGLATVTIVSGAIVSGAVGDELIVKPPEPDTSMDEGRRKDFCLA